MINRFKLVQLVAASLQTAVPHWLSITASEDYLVLRACGSRHEIYTWDDDIADDHLCRTLGYHILDELQDFVSIETREPWPLPVRPGAQIPLPVSLVQDGRLGLYFGDPTSPAIEFPAIAIADVLD